jgi:hypothetical protein
MIVLEPVKVAEALRNLSVSRTQYGRVSSMARLYGIPRPTLYRIEARFLEGVCRKRTSHAANPREKELEAFRSQVAALQRDNVNLRIQVDQLQGQLRQTLSRCRFWLIGLGLPARVIARFLRMCFHVPANRTEILRLAKQYASRASQIMKESFWPLAEDADLDEIFVESLPLYVASEPRALAILKTSIEKDRTVSAWSTFLHDLPNLRRTTSDRGQAIMGAVARHAKLHSQSDVFHPKMLLRDRLRVMETQCYSLMTREEHLQQCLEKTRKRGRDCRATAVRLYKVAQQTRTAISLFDELESAVNIAFDALRITTAKGTFNSRATAHKDLQFAKSWIQEHLPNDWNKVKNALDDEKLLTFLTELEMALPSVPVQSPTLKDREFVLVTLAKLWEDQAQRRYRGKSVFIPERIQQQLQKSCSNLPEAQTSLFQILDQLHRASSGVECINSRVGFYRYSKRRFSADFANLIAVWHNLSPFEDGKRAGKSPAQILNVKLSTYDLFQLFNVA